MYNSERSKYIVLQDFVAKMPMAQSNVSYRYIKCDVVTLRDTGLSAYEWLREGKIAKLED